MNPFPDVESGSETEQEAGSVYKVQEVGVATRIRGRERVEEAGHRVLWLLALAHQYARLHGGSRNAEKAEVGREEG